MRELGSVVWGQIRVGAVRAIAAAAIGACGLLAGCSQEPLNLAPIIDRSVPPPGAAPVVRAEPNAAPSGDGAMYTVQQGDTLYHIAAVAHVGVQDLARWNGIEASAPIFVGQRLRLQAPAAVPPAAAVTAPAPDDAAAQVVATPVPMPLANAVETRALETHPLAPAADATAAGAGTAPVAPTLSAAKDAVPAPLPAAPAAAAPPDAAAPRPDWIWPVDGTVTARFDPQHGKDIEIAAPDDAPVVAVAEGTVSYVGTPREFGNLVVVRHDHDVLSVYAHTKAILVKEGEVVRQGQPVAMAGKTPGSATLHFAVRRNGTPVDPLDLLPPR